MRAPFHFLFCVLAPLCIQAEFDLDIIILDDRYYNSTKFAESIAAFNPTTIENGTERRLFFSPAVLKLTGFINPVICVGIDCYSEANVSQHTPTPTVSSTPDTVIIASSICGVTAVFLGSSCYFLVKRKKKTALASRFERVIIRETIDWPPHFASQVKSGSKFTRGLI